MLLIQENTLPEIAQQSLRNCHAMGLDSVMFDNTPGARFRAFIAHPWHEMYHNWNGGKLSVAVHQHHCDVELLPIFGSVWNMRPLERRTDYVFSPFTYTSQIHRRQRCNGAK